MGILNVTPDSFSDGGCYVQSHKAVEHALNMLEMGADIIDIGGESTRPGAEPVTLQQELERVVPVVVAIRQQSAIPISVDTSHPEVMQAAVAAGASMINDVRALTRPGALSMAASLQVPVCLMHMQGQPTSMQDAPEYQDPVIQIKDFLQQRVQAALQAGVQAEHLLLDPGFGFGKRLAHNLALLRDLPRLADLGYPLLIGVSRKSMLGEITQRPVAQRLSASIAAMLLAVQGGARVVRVHDVAETCDALAVLQAVSGDN